MVIQPGLPKDGNELTLRLWKWFSYNYWLLWEEPVAPKGRDS